jgi:histidinol dehydrogenase
MDSTALRIFRTEEMSLAAICRALQPTEADIARVQAIVDGILAEVRARGDAAVLEFTRQFDWPEATAAGLRVSEAEIAAAVAATDPAVVDAMRQAAANIRRYHERQMPEDWFEEMQPGLRLGLRHTPVDSVACYVPTSKASLPSSLLMSVVPAQVAGVPRIAVAGPCRRDGTLPPGVLAAAALLGVTEIYKLGGAVAVAALAYGTESVPQLDKFVGPTNLFGTLAKRAVFGEIGIDGLYGPSDVTIVADGSVPAAWAAADMLSQAEHGEDSAAILVTPDAAYAAAVSAEVERQLATAARRGYLSVSLERFGGIIITRDLAEAAEMANLLAAEHLELLVADAPALLPAIRHAGAIFLGAYAPVPVGDYFAGPSHTLPTGRTARFSSGLGVATFLKRSSLIMPDAAWLAANRAAITTLAGHEGLPAHAEAVALRGE